jgi:hypothetical protein
MRIQDLSIQKLQNKLKSGGQNVLAYDIKRKNNQRLSRNEVYQIAEKLRKELQARGNTNGVIGISTGTQIDGIHHVRQVLILM